MIPAAAAAAKNIRSVVCINAVLLVLGSTNEKRFQIKWHVGDAGGWVQFELADPNKAHSNGFRENGAAIDLIVHVYDGTW
jgi:hypothetical protein